MNDRICILLGGLLGGLGVAAGALGAHGLKPILSPEQLANYEVAVRYQIFHALALVLLGLLLNAEPSRCGLVAAWAFLVGILLFCGCLYGWVFTGLRLLVHLVPVGGVAFLVGWAALAVAGWYWRPGLPR
jgi:uncharacterized membrane protein YgdD (TMEM256/DUF423 family)